MKLFIEIWITVDRTITDKISIYFNEEDVIIHKKGSKYDNLFNKIKNMTKKEIIEYFEYKHIENEINIFTNAC